jgi:hypothetical protein
MSPTFAEEAKLAGLLSPAFDKEAFRVNRSLPITFVCGGNNSNGNIALRHQFLEKISKAPRQILSVLAERAYPHQQIVRNLHEF